MNNLLRTLICSSVFILFSSNIAFADIIYDKSKVSDGIVGIQYTGDFSKPIKAMVEKDGERYSYTIKDNNLNYVPLQVGTGVYTVSVLQQIEGTKHLSLSAESISVSKIHPTNMYTYPTLMTQFNSTMKSIKSYGQKVNNKSEKDTTSYVYKDVVENYSYDYEKVNNLPTNYISNIDDMFMLKKGICLDYSSLLSGVLRSRGIPTKLVMGYAPEIKEYHSWNEIFIDNKWYVVDTTYDAAMVQAGHKTTFAKDPSKFKVLKVY